MTDLKEFRDRMKSFKSYRDENPGKTYLDWKSAIKAYKDIDIDNDPTYDYKGYYLNTPYLAWNMLNKDSDAHFTDLYKTSQHPTFSSESIYSGIKNLYNPEGIIGGNWGEHSYNLSDSQIQHNWNVLDTLNYLSNAEDEGINLMYNGMYPKLGDTVLGGVLPTINVTSYANGGKVKNNNDDYDSIYAGQLPEVQVKPKQLYATLKTFYPLTSKYTLTGHSELYTPLGYKITNTPNSKDYNLLTNNCSNATLNALNNSKITDTSPFLFTSPGDVKDAIANISGTKQINKSGYTILQIPITTKLAKELEYQSYLNSIKRGYNDSKLIPKKEFFNNLLYEFSNDFDDSNINKRLLDVINNKY